MNQSFRCCLAWGLTVGCLAGLTMTLRAASASGPEQLVVLLERYDREPDGPARSALAAQVDALAHQKYATVSRLSWFTDLASAKAAAREGRRPILHLRMLGNLEEDLSCANSRLFRATLYANQDVSRFLRERFILYWSSERMVPRVTIDYGDGRTLVRTTTGNSAHYILDEDGNVLDVLPGLYTAAAFRRELEGSLALAARVRGASDDRRAMLVVNYHTQHLMKARRAWAALAGTPAAQLLTELRIQSAVVAAQRATMAKMAIEWNDLRNFAALPVPDVLSESQVDMWSAAGRLLYGTRDVNVARPVLDNASRALVLRLHNDVPPQLRADGQRGAALVAQLERTLLADTALNELRLRPAIAREIVQRRGRTDFDTLNAWIYAEVFRSPKQDEWLGLLPRDVFTGVPGDGVIIR